MRLEAKLRKLARSHYWQNLYRASKDISGVQLFENVNNFSGLQVKFLYWLAVYNMLFEELLRHENSFITEVVIEDDIRCTAYLIWKTKQQEYEAKKRNQASRLERIKSKHAKKNWENPTLIDVDLRSE